ncbi:MAG: hypothetical protein O7F08_13620 [Deltaproteobacteria bacterium]|nr:hypothetical protein [Deltaproteobacteria bacterium]
MADLWPVPSRLTELRALPVRVKPNWRGFAAKFVGAVMWLGELLRVRAATRALDQYIQVIGGTIYAPRGSDGELGKSIRRHESTHDFQQRTRGKVRYVLGYFNPFSAKYRQHAEAQAYAVEVATGGRSLDGAADSASDPIYALRWERSDALSLISDYTKKWTKECRGVAEARKAFLSADSSKP